MKRISVLVFVGLLTACVTTTTSDPKVEVDLEKAADTHTQLGLNYLRQGDRKLARPHFNKALAINDQDAGALNGLALIFQMEKQSAEAEKYFKRAISADPSSSLARNNYAAYLFQQERYEEAQVHLAKVAEDFNYPRRGLALLNLGRTEVKLGNQVGAIEIFKQALALNYRFPQVHHELIALYFDRGEYTMAQHHFSQYDQQVRKKSAQSLLLGIRLEKIFGNKDKQASYALALKNLYPYSKEYLEYKKMSNL